MASTGARQNRGTGQVAEDNRKLPEALEAHLIPSALLYGEYDDLYDIFLEDRDKKVMDIIERDIKALRQQLECEMLSIE